MSSDEEGSIRAGNAARRQRLFSDDEDDDRSVASGHSRGASSRHDVGSGGRSDQRFNDGDRSGRDKDTDEEEAEEEEQRRKAEERQKKEEAKKKKPKGPVKRQMISEDMLTGKNGISKLPEIFEDFKFGGKGREKEDLNLILAKLEHWIHLLHPKQPFDQCLQRIEFLGLKRKVVKVHLKKLRMGMLSNFEADDNALIEDDLNDQDINLDEALEAASMVGGTKSQSLASQPGLASSNGNNANDDDEFPDDDELAELINQEASGNDKRQEVSASATQTQVRIPQSFEEDLDDMDIDFDEPFDGDIGDEYCQKQMQLAELAEKRAQTESTSVTMSTSAVADATTILIPTCDVQAAQLMNETNENVNDEDKTENDEGPENGPEESIGQNSDGNSVSLELSVIGATENENIPTTTKDKDGPPAPADSETDKENEKIVSNSEDADDNEDGIDMDDLADD